MTDDERGAVTAETALALPVLVGLTLVMVWMVAFGVGQMRTTDAAREAARALARGESEAQAAALVAAVDPGATMRVRIDGDRVVVTVTRAVAGALGVFGGLTGTTRATATAALEETTQSAPGQSP
ncbi:TadE family type IV pilus minor pilin [Nocardioides daejeonensis]|uniref:TadE family type IV pilus minor pilin n=1 Tax=Nocardioides daejeonensis TaxID=1046556 RepID=UPI000D740367|nr:TadE family type IV pilus minor pilin [Nocardioides daejeonensis]